jgi:FKBP-type peptidyl-prolyl cis-trans isomerase FkpA
MKKYFLLFSVFIITLSACKKGDVVATQATVDDEKIQAYLGANYGLNNSFVKDPSGVYYMIITPGNGAYPTLTSNVKIAYTGKYLDGQTFQMAPSGTYLLSSLVQGFQIGIPHINGLGRILLIIPSGLGYGPAGSGSIPPNSCLVFTVDLLGFF